MLTHILLAEALHRDETPQLALLIHEQAGTAHITLVRLEAETDDPDHPLSIHYAGSAGEDDTSSPALRVAVDLGDLHDAVALLHQSSRRLDARGVAEQELEQREIAQAEQDRLRRTADRAATRVDELVDELQRADHRIAELDAQLQAAAAPPPQLAPAGDASSED